jgi:branched-chain amino acid transport system substrate-binding protein
MPTLGRVFAVVVALFGLSGCRSSPGPEPVLIGHLAPFSGPGKLIGEHGKQAILLAVEDVNQEGSRILGRRLAVLHPSYLPDDLEKLQPVAVRLITVDKVVALVGGIDTDQAKSLGRAAEPYEVPLITPAELPPELLGDNVFSVNAGLAFRGQALARFAAKELHVNRVAVWVDGRRAATTALAAAFTREFSKGKSALAQEWTYKNAPDLSEFVERVKKFQAQAILHAGYAVDLGRLRAKLQEAGLKLPVLAGSDGELLTGLQADKDMSDGVYTATPFVAGEGPSATEDFVKRYRDRFQEDPDIHAALAYDGIRVLFEAMRRAKSFQPTNLRKELANSEANPFESLSGPMKFDKNHAARRPLYVVQIENGQLRRPILYPAESQ